jgi:hypothetical protein
LKQRIETFTKFCVATWYKKSFCKLNLFRFCRFIVSLAEEQFKTFTFLASTRRQARDFFKSIGVHPSSDQWCSFCDKATRNGAEDAPFCGAAGKNVLSMDEYY